MSVIKRFTLIELLIVVAIIGILVTMLMPSLHSARERARRAVCMSNMKQQGHLATIYAKNFKAWTPIGPSTTYNPNSVGGERNLKRAGKVLVLGFALELGYTSVGAADTAMYCPSRHPKERYSTKGQLGLNGDFSRRTIEYSYQHRTLSKLHDFGSEDVYGSDVAISDNLKENGNGEQLWNVHVGAERAHGDGYYNIIFYDMHVKPFYDLSGVLPAIGYYNNVKGSLDKINQMVND